MIRQQQSSKFICFLYRQGSQAEWKCDENPILIFQVFDGGIHLCSLCRNVVLFLVHCFSKYRHFLVTS